MRTYTLFLPGVTEDDCPVGDDEFDVLGSLTHDIGEIDLYSVPNSPKANDEKSDNLLGLDGDDTSSDGESEVFIPEVIEMSTFNDIFVQPSSYMPEEQYDELPEYYFDRESWIKSTNLHCISCSNKIQGMPLFVPLSWNKRVVTNGPKGPRSSVSQIESLVNRQKVVERKCMKVYRLTCNERCAKQYITNVKDRNITKPWESMQLLKELVQDIRGVKVNDIADGIDKSCMMQYCGPGGISAQSFRDKNSIDGIY